MIESSPFLRALETAAAIAKEIGVNQINTNYLYCEWLKKQFFPDGSPLENLEICQMAPDDYSNTYMQGVNVLHDNSRIDQVNYPEEWGDQFERAKTSLKDMKYKYRFTNRKTAHIVITHGGFTKAFAKYSGGAPGSPVKSIDVVPYCGIAAISIKGSECTLCWDGNNNHLRQLNKEEENMKLKYQLNLE